MKRRGSAMALYAAFLALVGLPLLLITVDMTRMMVRKVHLANAVEAACTAYAHTPDIPAIRTGKPLELADNARQNGVLVFLYNMGSQARITRMSSELVAEGGSTEQVLASTCSGEADYWPMLFGGRVVYQVRHTVTIKSKLGGVPNW